MSSHRSGHKIMDKVEIAGQLASLMKEIRAQTTKIDKISATLHRNIAALSPAPPLLAAATSTTSTKLVAASNGIAPTPALTGLDHDLDRNLVMATTTDADRKSGVKELEALTPAEATTDAVPQLVSPVADEAYHGVVVLDSSDLAAPTPTRCSMGGLVHNTDRDDPMVLCLLPGSTPASFTTQQEAFPTPSRLLFAVLETNTLLLTRCSTNVPIKDASTVTPKFTSGALIDAHSTITMGDVAHSELRPLPWPSFTCNQVWTLILLEKYRGLAKIAASGIPWHDSFGMAEVQGWLTAVVELKPWPSGTTFFYGRQLQSGQFWLVTGVVLNQHRTEYSTRRGIPEDFQWSPAWFFSLVSSVVFYYETWVLYSLRNRYGPAGGFVRDAWTNSWLELLLFGDECSFEALLGCHITRTCLLDKHMGLTPGGDASYGECIIIGPCCPQLQHEPHERNCCSAISIAMHTTSYSAEIYLQVLAEKRSLGCVLLESDKLQQYFNFLVELQPWPSFELPLLIVILVKPLHHVLNMLSPAPELQWVEFSFQKGQYGSCNMLKCDSDTHHDPTYLLWAFAWSPVDSFYARSDFEGSGIVSIRELSSWNYSEPCGSPMLLTKGQTNQCCFAPIQWNIAWPLHLDYSAGGNQFAQPLFTNSVQPSLLVTFCMYLGKGTLSWNPTVYDRCPMPSGFELVHWKIAWLFNDTLLVNEIMFSIPGEVSLSIPEQVQWEIAWSVASLSYDCSVLSYNTMHLYLSLKCCTGICYLEIEIRSSTICSMLVLHLPWMLNMRQKCNAIPTVTAPIPSTYNFSSTSDAFCCNGMGLCTAARALLLYRSGHCAGVNPWPPPLYLRIRSVNQVIIGYKQASLQLGENVSLQISESCFAAYFQKIKFISLLGASCEFTYGVQLVPCFCICISHGLVPTCLCRATLQFAQCTDEDGVTTRTQSGVLVQRMDAPWDPGHPTWCRQFSPGPNEESFQGGRGVIAQAAFFEQVPVGHKYYFDFDQVHGDNHYYLDAVLNQEPLSFDYYLDDAYFFDLAQVHFGKGYHRDYSSTKKRQVSWGPGGKGMSSAWGQAEFQGGRNVTGLSYAGPWTLP